MIALSNPEKIALLTDSTADLPAPMREGKPIYVVPLKIRCEDGEYSDGVDITAEGVYERLHRGELPRTSLPEGGVLRTFRTPLTPSPRRGMTGSSP